MASTPNFGLPYPDGLDDPNNVPEDLQQLAAATDGALTTLRGDLRRTWQAYTVTWQGTGTLAIGNGTLAGRYLHTGRVVHYEILLIRGSSTNVGTGLYNFSLPMAASEWRNVSGSGYFRRGSEAQPLTAVGVATGSIGLIVPAGRVSNTRPGSWAEGDELFVAGSYRVPSASI